MRRLAGVLAIALVLAAGGAGAAELQAVITDQGNEPVADAVVVAVPKSGAPPPARPLRESVDQIDKEFVPYVKAVLVGSAVSFPNNDNIRHHVYSFSPVKTFELPLYAGTPAMPVVFDRPGVVTIGCNIHDWMIAFIYVAESPYFGTSGRQGTVKLENLPPGPYVVRVWHPRMQGREEATSRPVTLGAGATPAAWQLSLRQDVRPRRAPVAGPSGYR